MPTESEPKNEFKFAHGFGIGCGAAVTLYAIFVIRHFNECSAFLDSKSGGSIALMGLSLAVVVAASGFVTAWSNATGPKNAFFTGLGIPGFLLAADIGSGGQPAPPQTAKASFGLYALLADAASDGSPGAAALILSPFSTVTAVRRERVEKRVEQQVAASRLNAQAEMKRWSGSIETALKRATADFVAIPLGKTKPAVKDLTSLAEQCQKWGESHNDPEVARYVGEELPKKLRKISDELEDPINLLRMAPALSKVASGVQTALRALRTTPDLGEAIRVDLNSSAASGAGR